MTDTDRQIRGAIKSAMTQQKITQQELADRLGVKQPSVAAVLSGKRGAIPSSLLAILTALDLELTTKPANKGKR